MPLPVIIQLSALLLIVVKVTEPNDNVPLPFVFKNCPLLPSDAGTVNVVPPDSSLRLEPSDVMLSPPSSKNFSLRPSDIRATSLPSNCWKITSFASTLGFITVLPDELDREICSTPAILKSMVSSVSAVIVVSWSASRTVSYTHLTLPTKA